MDSYSPMSLVLIRRMKLLSALARPLLLATAQGVNLRYHLPYFGPDEMAQYISHHLKAAGVSAALFTEEAVRATHEATQGAARAIGPLCSCCLLHAMSIGVKLVDDHAVKIVLENEYIQPANLIIALRASLRPHPCLPSEPAVGSSLPRIRGPNSMPSIPSITRPKNVSHDTVLLALRQTPNYLSRHSYGYALRRDILHNGRSGPDH